MKTLRFLLEYHCCPVWVLDEQGGLIGNGLPADMVSDKNLVNLINQIQEEYDNLFENTSTYFGYHGFENEFEKQLFFTKVNSAIDLLKQKVGNTYQIQVDVDMSDY